MLLRLFAVAIIFLILDQLTKRLIGNCLAEGQSASVIPWIRIRRVTNTRGVLLRRPLLLLVVLAALLGTISLVVQQGYFFQRRIAQHALGMALGGACSNLYDQLRHGAVMDLIDLGWWPVFNLADAAITVGVIIALWFLQ